VINFGQNTSNHQVINTRVGPDVYPLFCSIFHGLAYLARQFVGGYLIVSKTNLSIAHDGDNDGVFPQGPWYGMRMADFGEVNGDSVTRIG